MSDNWVVVGLNCQKNRAYVLNQSEEFINLAGRSVRDLLTFCSDNWYENCDPGVYLLNLDIQNDRLIVQLVTLWYILPINSPVIEGSKPSAIVYDTADIGRRLKALQK